MLNILNGGKSFIKDGKAFFYLADTVWSAFTNAKMDEWEIFLNYRKNQGFNVLQINILPQWDAVTEGEYTCPFGSNQDGSIDFDHINEDYFANAQEMMDLAYSKGFELALVVLWANYVSENWCSKMNPHTIMPQSRIEPYVKYISDRFKKYSPMYLVSGDAAVESDEEIQYYKTAIKALRKYSPNSLLTMHLGGCCFINRVFVEENLLDFYMFQSGHGFNEDSVLISKDPSILAREFLDIGDKKPIINGEPCYEGIINKSEGGRHQAYHVRRASWISLLSGAKAGITYGAHGIWSWYRKTNNVMDENLYSTPFDWSDALRLKGADDVAYTKWIFETHDLYDIQPIQLDKEKDQDIWVAATKNEDKIIAYIPYAKSFNLPFNLDEYDFFMIELENRNVYVPEVVIGEKKTTVKMNIYNCDAILIGEKR